MNFKKKEPLTITLLPEENTYEVNLPMITLDFEDFRGGFIVQAEQQQSEKDNVLYIDAIGKKDS